MGRRPFSMQLHNVKRIQKTILHPITAQFHPGKINVIMGPSGSGKTSLLRSLSMKTKQGVLTTYQTSGEVTLNGIPASHDMIKAAISFVAQDDDGLMPSLTVRETLRYAAGIRLPSMMSQQQKVQRAEHLIIQMCLSHCAENFIGSRFRKGISGGEKRQVSIAIQILADPMVLFPDEPTSGLDIWTASSVLDVLRALAGEGRTIKMTAHQSRSDAFDTYDNVLLMARGGSVVYHGEGKNVLSHFSKLGFECGRTTNPADFVIDLITVDLQGREKEDESRNRVDRIKAAWGTGPKPPRIECSQVSGVESLKPPRNSSAGTFSLVLRRSALKITRNSETIVARTSQVIGMVILFTLFFAPKSNEEGILTHMGFIQICTSFCIIGMLQNVAVYPMKRDIFYREFDDGCYGVFTFLTSYTILESSFNTLSSLCFGVLAAFSVDLKRTAWMFFVVFLNCFCSVSCGESLGIVFCTLFSSHIGLSMHASSAIFSIGSTMAGIAALDIPRVLQVINHISPFKYLVANIAVHSLRGRTFTCRPEQEVNGICPISTGEQVLELYKLDVDPRWNLILPVILTMVYRVMAFIVVATSRVNWRNTQSQFSRWKGRKVSGIV